MYLMYRKINIRLCCVAYFVCLFLLLAVCYHSKTGYPLEVSQVIDGSSIADYYSRYYNYGQAFRYVLGFSILQLILLLTYYIATRINIVTKRN